MKTPPAPQSAVGSFYRSLRLPEGVTKSDVQASYRDGVLEVTVTRPAAPEPRRLAVEVR